MNRMITREDVCKFLAGTLPDVDKARAIEEEMTKEGPSQVRDWLASVAEQSARLREQQASGELYRRLARRRKGHGWNRWIISGAAAAVAAVATLGLMTFNPRSTPETLVAHFELRAKALEGKPSNSSDARKLRQELVNSSISVAAIAYRSETLRKFLDRSWPDDTEQAQEELKSQLTRVLASIGAGGGIAGKDTVPPNLFLASTISPDLRRIVTYMYADIQKLSLKNGGNLDAELKDFVLQNRPAADRLGMFIMEYFQNMTFGDNKTRWDRLIAMGNNEVRVHGQPDADRRIKLINLAQISSDQNTPLSLDALAEANRAGIDVYAYVNCDGGGKRFEEAKGEVTAWNKLYGGKIRGIFFDNHGSKEKGRDDYFAKLFAFARDLQPSWQIISCPMEAFEESTFTNTKPDMLCYISSGRIPRLGGWEVKYDSKRFASVILDIDDAEQMPGLLANAATSHFGWVYVTISEGSAVTRFQRFPNYLESELQEILRISEGKAIRSKSPRIQVERILDHRHWLSSEQHFVRRPSD